MCAVEQLAFAEERAGRRVDVLRTAPVTELARAEPEHVASRVADGKHQATAEPVLQRPSAARSADKPDVAQLLRREPGRLRGAQQCRRVGGGKADSERLANGLADAARREVLGGPRGFRRPRASKVLRVEGGGAIQRFERSSATSTLGLGARILFFALQLDAGATREELERRREVEALLELDQAQHVAAGVAAEALEQLLARRDRERWRALVVQRTQPHHAVAACAPQLGVAAGEFDKVRCITHALLGFLGEAAQSAPLKAGQHRLWLLRRTCERTVQQGAVLRSFVQQIVLALRDRVAATARRDRTTVGSTWGQRVGPVRLVDACALGGVGADVGDGHSPPFGCGMRSLLRRVDVVPPASLTPGRSCETADHRIRTGRLRGCQRGPRCDRRV